MIRISLIAILLQCSVELTTSQDFSLATSFGFGSNPSSFDLDAFDPAAFFFPESSKGDISVKIDPVVKSSRVRHRERVSRPSNPFTTSDTFTARASPSEAHLPPRSRGIPLSRISRTQARSRTLPAELANNNNNREFTGFSNSGFDNESHRLTSRRVARPKPPTSPRQTSNDFIKTNDVKPIIGVSPCARGTAGEACRAHLQNTAMSCTQGSCFQCQNCERISPSTWVGCCRDHFLCCSPLAKACQTCDKLGLNAFCKIAFGKC